MRAREFVTEGKTGSITHDVGLALPGAFKIPALKNQDPYLQYRFGVAIAGAKGRKQREEDSVPPYARESAWGENQIVVSFDPSIEGWIDDALEQMGMRGKRRLSTMNSEESATVGKESPMKPFKGYAK